jgi:hypothetical protein
MGPDAERARRASALTMVCVGMGDAWRAHEFPHCHYGIIVLICQVYYFDYPKYIQNVTVY